MTCKTFSKLDRVCKKREEETAGVKKKEKGSQFNDAFKKKKSQEKEEEESRRGAKRSINEMTASFSLFLQRKEKGIKTD